MSITSVIDMERVDWEKVEEIMEGKKSWLEKRLKEFSANNPDVCWAPGDRYDAGGFRQLGRHSFLFFCLWYRHSKGNHKLEICPARKANPTDEEIDVLSNFVSSLLEEDTSLRARLVKSDSGLFIYNLGPKFLPIKEGS